MNTTQLALNTIDVLWVEIRRREAQLEAVGGATDALLRATADRNWCTEWRVAYKTLASLRPDDEYYRAEEPAEADRKRAEGP